MNLRLKSFLLFGLSLAAVIGVMCLAIREISVRSFDQIEQRGALRAVGRSRTLLQHRLDDLSSSMRYYTRRNSFAEDVAQSNRQEIEKTLSTDNGLGAGWDAYVIWDAHGAILDAREFSEKEAAFVPLADRTQVGFEQLFGSLALKDQWSTQPFVSVVGGNPYLVALARVTGREDQGKGTLLGAIRLNDRTMSSLAAMADARVHFVSAADAGVHEDAAATDKPDAIVTFLATAKDGRPAAFSLLRDQGGKPIGFFEVELDTAVREQAVFFARILIAVVLVLAALLCVIIDRIVFRPHFARLAQLRAMLNKIQHSSDLSARLPVVNNDEISLLGREANRMLGSIETSQRTLERLNAEMQQRVAERTAALAEANAALEADIANRITAEDERARLREQLLQAHKMEAVGTLAGGIAHDFNNILTGILGHAQLIEAELSPTSQARTNLTHVIDAAERAAALVHQILAFSRQSPGERHPISVSHVAREALSLLRAALPSGIEIKCVIESYADTINADPTQLHQVFMNLGANAGHAMGSRGGELEVKIHRVKRPPGAGLGSASGMLVEYVCISVRDTGCGMSADVMERIFDPFFSTKPVNEGTGLGLAVVHGIVTDHGGMIEVESKPGQGTTFRICLPPANAPALPKERDQPRSLHGTERILLVDDEDIVLSVAQQTLQRLGYKVTVARDGQEGLDLFKATPREFDLVITDQTMPLLTGLELTTAIKELRPHIPIILATGYSPDVAEQPAATLGLEGIIGKPINFAELTLLMRSALDRDKADLASHSPFNVNGW